MWKKREKVKSWLIDSTHEFKLETRRRNTNTRVFFSEELQLSLGGNRHFIQRRFNRWKFASFCGNK